MPDTYVAFKISTETERQKLLNRVQHDYTISQATTLSFMKDSLIVSSLWDSYHVDWIVEGYDLNNLFNNISMYTGNSGCCNNVPVFCGLVLDGTICNYMGALNTLPAYIKWVGTHNHSPTISHGNLEQTISELALENQSLKQELGKLNKRVVELEIIAFPRTWNTIDGNDATKVGQLFQNTSQTNTKSKNSNYF